MYGQMQPGWRRDMHGHGDSPADRLLELEGIGSIIPGWRAVAESRP